MSFTNNTYYNLFNKQKTNQYSVSNTTYKQRIKKLNVLKFTYFIFSMYLCEVENHVYHLCSVKVNVMASKSQ